MVNASQASLTLIPLATTAVLAISRREDGFTTFLPLPLE